VSDIMKTPNADGLFTHDIVAHKRGFNYDDMRKAFNAGDLHYMTFDKVTSAKKDGHTVEFFLAKGIGSL
jgi:hypothetical protein